MLRNPIWLGYNQKNQTRKKSAKSAIRENPSGF